MLLALLLAQGLTLRELQDLARKNDPRAQQAAAQADNAQGKREEAKWAWFPNFETIAYIAGPTPERRLSADNNVLDATSGAWNGVVAHIEMQAILPLYTFGKLDAGKAATQHLVGATDALLQRARDQAAFDTARAYWGFQTARNADDSVQKIRDRLTQAQATAKKLIEQESEQISKSDAAKLDYLAEEIEAKHAEAVKNRDLAFTGLKLITGKDELQVAQQDLPAAPAMPDPDKVLKTALERRPETKAASEGIAARQALVDLARAQLYPDFGLVGGARFTETTNADNPPSPFVGNPYHESSGYVAVAVRGTFDIPQKLARLHQAEADLREAQAMQAGAQQLVRLEVQQALGDLGEARVRADRYAKEAAIGKDLAKQAGVAFDSGLGEARELLEDTLLYARADGERLKALFDAQVAWAALEKAAGGPLQ
ncbi:MAG TPA: TolC family protein [Myxococcales bacterium]|nr:TolC family protein [Myxococcales bacterium]